MEEQHILSPAQHSFRKGLSTIAQHLELIHDAAQDIDNHKHIDPIFLDFSKAFDHVSDKRLIKKLEIALGGGPIVHWIKSYFSNRSQYVQISDAASRTTPITSGVPQGSVIA